ncbi:heavy-metal-associated domain-containing protein [Halopenitus persicus]|uniref:Copper chaperone CopZ n=1 Tax=Halopenitus persicus TaxID=1048396 RepID=A0A1H3H6L5_9EURY|nr:heavy metal-associated domain-containing protein [Halopenitus persicus]QHS16109.1 heavy-metal-associated domain-containing protein [haloarchaeon 3A1-DGR]SDY10404.1 Copper chaperone CopZ [Halopenitus persicus]
MTELTVSGMSCGGCETAVVDALSEVPGVEDATADHEAGVVTVSGDAETESVVAAIDDAGYEVVDV